MARRRSVTTYITATAGSTVGDEISTSDDNKRRTLVGVFVGDDTAKSRLLLKVAGQLEEDIDCKYFGTGARIVEVSVPVDSGIQLQPQIENGSSGTVTDVPVTLYYEF